METSFINIGGLVPNREGCKARAVHTRRVRFLRLLVLSVGLGLFSPAFATDAQHAREIVDRVDRLLRGDSSRGTVTMQIVTENWQRSLTMQILSPGYPERPGSDTAAQKGSRHGYPESRQ